MGVEMPRTLFQVDQKKVFGLTINPVVLQNIRKARAKTMGLSSEARTNYSEMDYVRGELEFAGRLFAQNPSWPVIGNKFDSTQVYISVTFVFNIIII